MKTYKIALYPGDGIGPEVVDQAVRVLDAVQARHGFQLDYVRLPWGYDYWREHSRVVPENFLDVLRPFDAILLGAVGWPAELPDHVTLAPLVKIRQTFEQYACIRPAKLLPGVKSVLVGKGPAEIDFVVLRENSEGEYVDSGSRFRQGQDDEVALQTAIHTRRGVERILRFGFEMARSRRQRLTMITKSNAQRYAYMLWDDLLELVRCDYPDITADKLHCDAAAMDFVRRPERFDVVVASNLFGDLLTDLGGVIGGGLGLAPSTNVNPSGGFRRCSNRCTAARGHRGPRHRQPRGASAQRRDDARMARRRRRCGDDPPRRRTNARRRQAHARPRRHALDDANGRRAGAGRGGASAL